MQRTESETRAQNAINAAAAEAASEYVRRVKAQPRWRRWLVNHLAPQWPTVMAQMPQEVIYLTEPLNVGPGVCIMSVISEIADPCSPVPAE